MKGDKACHVLLDSAVKICPFLHWIEEFIAMRSALAILWTAQISECGLMINGNRKIEEDLNWFWPEVTIEINPIHFLSFLRLYLCNSTVIKNTIHVHILRAKIIWKYKQAVHAISLQDELRGELCLFKSVLPKTLKEALFSDGRANPIQSWAQVKWFRNPPDIFLKSPDHELSSATCQVTHFLLLSRTCFLPLDFQVNQQWWWCWWECWTASLRVLWAYG